MSAQRLYFRKERDAFGQMLLDYLVTGEATEIIEREDGYIDGDLSSSNYFAEFPDWPESERQAMDELRSGRVLDLGCGAGRVELYLQSQGFEVVGIDNSPLSVEVCRRRGVKDVRLISVTQVSQELGVFDNIVMLGNNWGLMGSFKRARWLLKKFYAMTSPEARIVAESNDIYQTDSPLHLAYQVWNRERGRMSGQIRMRCLYHLHRSKWFDYLMVSKAEMRQILEGTGWQVSRFIDSQGSSYIAIIDKI